MLLAATPVRLNKPFIAIPPNCVADNDDKLP